MTAQERLFVMVKLASPLGAGLSGLFGPLGSYAYGKFKIPEEDQRYALMGQGALGGALGGLGGTLAGIPVSMVTGVPILPGMALGAIGGSLGSGVGAALAAKRYREAKEKGSGKTKKKKKEDHE